MPKYSPAEWMNKLVTGLFLPYFKINLSASPSYTSHSGRAQFDGRHLIVANRSAQPNLRSLLADTGQFLASLLVGPKAAASARCRLSKTSRLALYRILYIVFSYIENAEVSTSKCVFSAMPVVKLPCSNLSF